MSNKEVKSPKPTRMQLKDNLRQHLENANTSSQLKRVKIANKLKTANPKMIREHEAEMLYSQELEKDDSKLL